MLKMNKLELVEVGYEEPFRVYFQDNPLLEKVLWVISTANILELINDDGGYNRYKVELRTMTESSPGEFLYKVQVRKLRGQNVV